MRSTDVTGFVPRGAARSMTLAAACLLATLSNSLAQTQESYVVTTADGAQLRCGQGAGFYRIGRLDAGQVLAVIGESNQWMHVYTPLGTEAYVSHDAVIASLDARWVTLRTERSLRHVNPRTGKRGSWKPMFDAPLPAGTRLQVVTFEDSEAARQRAYRVIAPRGATAYIEASVVRAATADEIALFKASVGAPAGHGDLLRPGVEIVGPTGPSDTQDDSQRTPGGEFVPGSDGQPDRSESVPGLLQPGTPDRLEAAFQAVKGQPALEAEYDEMIAEFRRAIEALGDRPDIQPLRAAYQQRLDYLLLRKEIQAARLASRRSLEDLDKQTESLADTLLEMDKNRRYVVIGRLTTSIVYDGQRLPLMYRIQSVGDRVPRTLGYLKPGAGFDLAAKVGRVVGVEGTTLLDQSLRLNVVTPTRVDVLTPEQTDADSPEAPPTDPPADKPAGDG
ncbi:MAG: SH3 domain-containing protein [Planctomycetes bacterium]|nr:SH3 domain-containing protein [Planctomycetota bacterium]